MAKAIHVQALVTQRCNAICDYCDKAVGLAKMPDIEMTAALMRHYVDQVIQEGVIVSRITLSGGEPILNKELQDIIYEASRLPGLLNGRVLTNDLAKTKEQRGTYDMPEPFHWSPSPLDDPYNPTSGKNQRGIRYRNRTHVKYFVSPADIGVEANFENCTVKSHCGKGLDNNGWSMCGQAPILGRILGVDPYPQEGTILERVNKPIPEICRHCRYGVAKGQKHLVDEYPGDISPTFAEAFSQKPRPDFRPVQLGVRQLVEAGSPS